MTDPTIGSAICTLEDLDALPVGTRFQDRMGDVGEVVAPGTVRYPETADVTTTYAARYLPAMVLAGSASNSADVARVVDALPLTQYLLMEVLAARRRLGEDSWTFPSRALQPLRKLEELGLVRVFGAATSGDVRATLTPTGLGGVLGADYTTPVDRLRERVEQEIRDKDRVWALLREEQQTSRTLRALVTQMEAEHV